jgi:hypothetical protein
MQGIVLTDCVSVDAMLDTVRGARIPLLKVVTGWGASWDEQTRLAVCTLMPEVLVRTVSGDGCSGPPALAPDAVLAELRPWYDARSTIAIEIGNEPNAYDPSDDAAWNFRYWFIETLNTVRESLPEARIVSPGLIETRQTEWWIICQDAFELADQVGFHAYAYHDFDDTGQLGRALDDLALIFPNHTWLLTECGINDMATSPETKATRYAKLAAKLPSQVGAACWYHFAERPSNNDQAAYALPPPALPYLYAGGTL